MADPLTLLRQFNTGKKNIVERDDQIIFDTILFMKTVKTNYTISRTAPKDYYTLEALLFLLKNVHLSHPMYVERARSSNFPAVRFPDRKDLLAYLSGEKETSTSVDKSAPLELPLSRTASIGVKRVNDDTSNESSKRLKGEESQQARQQQADIQEWLSMKLQEKKEGAVTAESLMKDAKSGLNEVMSIDRIAEIKRKIMTRKRGTIKGDDHIELDPDGQAEEQQSNLAASSFVGGEGGDNDMTKDIISRERQLRTRTTVLQSNGKQFLQNILAILTSVKAQEEGKTVQVPVSPVKTVVKEPPRKAAEKPVSYNRYDQERFDSQKETEGFKIDTMATFHGLSLQSVKEGKSQRRTLPSPSPHTTPNRSPRHTSSGSGSKPQKRESKTPIIIVPAALTSLVTLQNAQQLLQDFKFAAPSGSKEPEVLVQRKKEVLIGGQMQTVTVPFRIVDQPLKLQPNEWNRVAAVFVQGPLWQFKGWPGVLPDGSPTEIFTKVRAFYMKYVDSKTDPNVAKWDVHVLAIHRNRRHMDRALLMQFWELLDKFLTKTKPQLRF